MSYSFGETGNGTYLFKMTKCFSVLTDEVISLKNALHFFWIYYMCFFIIYLLYIFFNENYHSNHHSFTYTHTFNIQQNTINWNRSSIQQNFMVPQLTSGFNNKCFEGFRYFSNVNECFSLIYFRFFWTSMKFLKENAKIRQPY